jgi:phosphoribosylformylglycinamidine cyclo-ligase
MEGAIMAQRIKQKSITYAGSGVDYGGGVDQLKVDAGELARTTAHNLKRRGFSDVAWSRGESVHLIENDDMYLGQITEGLGTKSKVADAMYKLTGKSYHDNVAQCTLAMIVNDPITLGAMPLDVCMYLGAGASEWFQDRSRYMHLLDGWRRACELARCSWGGGETPVLKGVIMPDAVDIAGSANCIIEPKSRLIKGNIQDGDRMVFIGSNGVHANGLTLCRHIAEYRDPWWKVVVNKFFLGNFSKLKQLPYGYATLMSDGRMYGEALLDPTHIYVALMDNCLAAGVDVHYAVNVTGHGWRKFMRAAGDFTYRIYRLPRMQAIFEFIQRHGPVSWEEMYKTFNMGIGFALYVPKEDVERVIQFAKVNGLDAWEGGIIEAGEKQVIIEPMDITFKADSMTIR